MAVGGDRADAERRAVGPGRAGDPRIRAFAIADTSLHREGLEALVRQAVHIDLVGAAADVAAALAGIRELHPDVVLIDAPMPERVSLVRAVVDVAPGARVVTLGVSDLEEHFFALEEAGASGYVMREGSLADLEATVESVARGEALIPPAIAAALLTRIRRLTTEHRPPAAGARVRLTPRELEILELLDRGLSNKQIAAHLFIGVATVKSHVHNILTKLQVKRRSEAAGWMKMLFPSQAPPAGAQEGDQSSPKATEI